MAGVAPANAVVVNPGTVHQHISGFGASSAWEAGYLNAADPTTLFSTTSGAGLSLFRVRIQPSPAGTTSAAEISMALAAQALGATVWATPWTPPASDKSNATTIEGTLTDPSAWAASLASYVTTMKAAGIHLYAISAQNEPDADVTYESCVYTATTLATFVGGSMGPALASSGVKIMAPETQDWGDFKPRSSRRSLSNSAAWAATSIVATHEYGGTPAAYPEHPAQAGKEFWETEWYVTPASGGHDDGQRPHCGQRRFINALTVANMNAWHYWWFYSERKRGPLGHRKLATWAKRLWVHRKLQPVRASRLLPRGDVAGYGAPVGGVGSSHSTTPRTTRWPSWPSTRAARRA
jgi:glucuronoarabinoxylan endo-1,4-beta-xylanase